MSRKLNDLDPRFRPLAMELLARLTEAGLPVLIVDTLRTAEEQAEAVRTGHSHVTHSRHQDGMAIDVCPYEVYQAFGPDKLLWSTTDPAPWSVIGVIAEGLGLRWGGRFAPLDRNGLGWDPGHCELPARMTRSGEVA